MLIGFDSNILIYLAGGGRGTADDIRIAAARRLYRHLIRSETFVAPVQAIGEAMHILVRKYEMSGDDMRTELARWKDGFEICSTSLSTLKAAVALVGLHQFQHWDAVIVTAAVEADCAILLSEDMQDGFVWRGLTIVNPFADPVHPLLASLLAP